MKTGIRALLSKSRVLMFDLECPYCDELLATFEGTLSFSIHESCNSFIKCNSCGKTSRTPKTVRSAQIVKSLK